MSLVKRKPSPVVFFDTALMPTYKSVTYMIENDLVVEPDILIKNNGKHNLEFDAKCNAFVYLKDLARKRVDGYGIIRVKNKAEAKFLEWNIQKRIKGKQIFIKHWNQKEKIDPQTYFSELREGVLVIVIVQKKAAMGNSIPTTHMRMMYDFSPNAALSTISQGLLGRCCGHGKLCHLFPVFTHVNHAKAYSLFEQNRMAEFANFLREYKIRPSQRSKVYRVYIPIHHGSIETDIDDMTSYRARTLVEGELKKQFGDLLYISGTIVTRFLSKQNNPAQKTWYLDQIKKGSNPVSTRSLESTPGKTAIFYDHRSKTIYYGHRLEGSCKYAVGAKDNSFYSQL